MTDLNQASTIEEDEAFQRLAKFQEGYNIKPSIDWQKEYQALFVTKDQHLTRAIEAEGKLAIAKNLIAEQEIDIRMWEDRHAKNLKEAKEASNHMLEARRHLDKLGGFY